MNRNSTIFGFSCALASLISTALLSTTEALAQSAPAVPVRPTVVPSVPVDIADQCSELIAADADLRSDPDAKLRSDLQAALSAAPCIHDIEADVAFCKNPTDAPTRDAISIAQSLEAMVAKRQELIRLKSAIFDAERALKEASGSTTDAVVTKLTAEANARRAALERFTKEVSTSMCDTKAATRVSAFPGSVALEDTILRGLAGFVSARLKGELSLALETKLTSRLCGNEDAKQLFSSSCALLSARARQDNEGIQAWGTLKAAFEADLQQLPVRVLALVFTQQRVGASAPVALEVATFATDILEAASKGQDVVRAFRTQALPPSQKCDNPSRPGCLRFALSAAVQALSNHLDAPTSTAGSFDLYAKIVLKELMTADPKLGDLLAPEKLSVRIEAVRKLRAQLELLQAIATRTDKTEDRVSAYLTAIAPLFKQAAILWQGADVEQGSASCAGETTTSECLVWIGDRIDRCARLFDDVRARNYSAAWVEALTLAEDFGARDKLPDWVNAYGSFAVQLASAKDSAQAQEAIESAALPLGSYANKREYGNFAMTVTAFPGARYGQEWVESDNVNAPSSSARHGGMAAPIGLDMTLGLGAGWSLGLMVSVLDLGNLVDYRLDRTENVSTSDSTQKADVASEPSVGFAQVVSPGAFATVGLFDTPLVLGGGVSLAPGLRRIENTTTGATSKGTVVQVSVFLAVDVSIFSVVN